MNYLKDRLKEIEIRSVAENRALNFSNPLVALLSLLLGVSVFASVFAVFLYSCLEWVSSMGVSRLDRYLQKGYGVFFSRALFIGLFIAIPLLIKIFRVKSFADFFGRTIDRRRDFFNGVLQGLASLLVLIVFQSFFYTVQWSGVSFYLILVILIKFLLGGLVVAFIEEIIFRSIIFRALASNVGVLCGLLFSSAFFAYVHFKPDYGLSIQEMSAWDGLRASWIFFFGPRSNFELIPFLSLFSLGGFLCVLFLVRGSLLAPVGFHFAIIIGSMFYKKLWALDTASGISIYCGTQKLTDGVAVIVVLILLTLVNIAYGFLKAR